MELEKKVLGALLVDRYAYQRISDILTVESFYAPSHQIVFEAISRLSNSGRAIDIENVLIEVERAGMKLQEDSPAYFLISLTNKVVNATSLESDARIVQQMFLRREVIRVSGENAAAAYDKTIDEFEMLADCESKIMAIGNKVSTGKIVPISEVLVQSVTLIEKARQSKGSLTGIASGLAQLDMVTSGWQPGDLVIVAARPSVGKSAFGLHIARKAAMSEKKIGVAVWSLEMSAAKLALRMMSAQSGVWLSKMTKGYIEEWEMQQVYNKAITPLSEANIFFDESDEINVRTISAQATRMKKKYDIGLIVVDYLQLVESAERAGSREQEISKISRDLKKLAKRLGIPVIALSQLSREVEKRSNPMPQLSDLRESGAIEQDADMVIFLWAPPEGAIEQDPNLKNRVYARIAKHRDGELVTADLDFHREIQLFTDHNHAEPAIPPPGFVPVKNDLPF